MSTTENAPAQLDTDDPLPPPTEPGRRRGRDGRRDRRRRGGLRGRGRRGLAAGVTGVAVVVAATGGLWLSLREEVVPVTAPLTLPATLDSLGRLPEASDPTKVERWQKAAATAAKGTTLAAQGYGTPGASRTVRAVAARSDLTGQLELAWPVDAGRQVGDVRCTQNVRLVANGRAAVRPTVVVCWRTSAELSAYVVIIDPKATVQPKEGAAALEELWDTIS